MESGNLAHRTHKPLTRTVSIIVPALDTVMEGPSSTLKQHPNQRRLFRDNSMHSSPASSHDSPVLSPYKPGSSWYAHQSVSPRRSPRIQYNDDPMSPRRRSSLLVGQRSLEIMEEMGQKEPKFVKLMIKLYRKWGIFISKYAWSAIIICVMISMFALVKILLTPQRNDLTGYSPAEARAKIEYEVYKSFFSRRGLPIATYIFVTAKDGGSVIRDDHLKETVDVLDLALNNITLYNRETKRYDSFNDFCVNFCAINEPVRQFYNAYLIQKSSIESGSETNALLKLRYPISTLFGRSVSMQPYFFGVELHDENDTAGLNKDIINDTTKLVTNMNTVKMISLQFRAMHNPAWSDDDVKGWEMDIVKYFGKEYKSEHLVLHVLSKSYIEDEMVRAGTSLLPYLTAGFIIMCTCSVVTVMIRAAYMHQSNIFKALLAIMACVTPLLACATALAILFICGMRFASILCVIPFLVLSIGVDSSYLMIHEWQHVTKEIRDGEKAADSVAHRMSEVLSEVGPAILISAITNILADGVGCITSSPEIRLLCVGNLFSMFMAYIYQMSFYTGLMSIVGRYEISAEKEDANVMNIAIKGPKVRIRKNSELVRKNSKFHDTSKLYISKYMAAYVKYMIQPTVASFTISIYILYVIISVWGITRININLTTQKLFARDSPLIELDNLRVEYQVPVFTMVSVFIDTPGDLSHPDRLTLMNSMVDDFEKLNGSWGRVGTMYFVRDFITFENHIEDDFDYEVELESGTKRPSNPFIFKNEDLAAFLIWPEYDFWTAFIQLSNETAGGSGAELKRFFFTTGYRDEKLKIWTERGKLLKQWRSVVDKPAYTTFNAAVFHEDGIYLDLIDNMATDTWQSVVGTLICMAAVCFIFLRSILTVCIATTCVLSICTGILGILSWWHIDLDPITMAAMVISIGFSVDIPAHVSYHYYKACASGPRASPEARLGNCLTSVAFPAVQAALSTTLCVCSLLFVDNYMSEAFVKTMTICVFLCNLHGLVFLPAILSMVDRIKGKFVRKKIHMTEAEKIVRKRINLASKKVSMIAEAQENEAKRSKDTPDSRPTAPN